MRLQDYKNKLAQEKKQTEFLSNKTLMYENRYLQLSNLLESFKTTEVHEILMEKSIQLAETLSKNDQLQNQFQKIEKQRQAEKQKVKKLNSIVRSVVRALKQEQRTAAAKKGQSMDQSDHDLGLEEEDDEKEKEVEDVRVSAERAVEMTLQHLKGQVEMLEDHMQAMSAEMNQTMEMLKVKDRETGTLKTENALYKIKVEMLGEICKNRQEGETSNHSDLMFKLVQTITNNPMEIVKMVQAMNTPIPVATLTNIEGGKNEDAIEDETEDATEDAITTQESPRRRASNPRKQLSDPNLERLVDADDGKSPRRPKIVYRNEFKMDSTPTPTKRVSKAAAAAAAANASGGGSSLRHGLEAIKAKNHFLSQSHRSKSPTNIINPRENLQRSLSDTSCGKNLTKANSFNGFEDTQTADRLSTRGGGKFEDIDLNGNDDNNSKSSHSSKKKKKIRSLVDVHGQPIKSVIKSSSKEGLLERKVQSGGDLVERGSQNAHWAATASGGSSSSNKNEKWKATKAFSEKKNAIQSEALAALLRRELDEDVGPIMW